MATTDSEDSGERCNASSDAALVPLNYEMGSQSGPGKTRTILLVVLILGLAGVAFTATGDARSHLATARRLASPSLEIATALPPRQLVDSNGSPAGAVEVQQAIAERLSPPPLSEQPASESEVFVPGQSEQTQVNRDTEGEESPVADLADESSNEVVATTTPGNGTAPDESPAPQSATTTTTRAPRSATTTTRAPRSTTPATTPTPPQTTSTTSTTAPPITVRPAVAQPSGDWVSPGATGHRNSLHSFPAANDGPHGVTINQAFLDQHQNAPWLSYENGRPIISRANADGLCLNITVTLTLRDSRVNCPTRTQNDSWGYAGRIDDAPAVNILAGNVVVEYNTITCSGRDGNICGRNVRVGAKDALIQYNDLSFARGAVEVFTGTVFRFNYAHDFSFGFDPSRASNPSDNITHNNPINNLGYSAQVHGNYIVARYGRVSAQPNTYRNPHFHNVYSGGVVEVGDPLNGFAFVNYLVNGPGNGYRVTDNYFVDVGRAFLCNNSDRHANSSCADDISRNVFADHHFDDFQGVFFRDEKGRGSINGSCNVEGSNSSSFNVLPSSAFGTGKNHNTNNC